MQCGEIIEIIEKRWSKEYACSWDNVGLLVGDRNQEIKNILLALDVTDDIIDQAEAIHADMIITHHPMIFREMKHITEDDFIGRRVTRLIRAEISHYAMHTNFDVLGMGEAAAQRISLQNRQVLECTNEVQGEIIGIGQVGALPQEMTLYRCAELVKTSFGLEHLRIFGEAEHMIKRAAISPGSGSSVIDHAIQCKADVLITGDISHHHGLDAVARNLMVIDAGHFGLESLFSEYMEEFFAEHIPEVRVQKGIEQSPFWII